MNKVLIYVGQSLDEDSIRERVADPIIRGPIKQSDLISDLMRYEPTHVLIIDGLFSQNLSVWLKEILFGLRLPFVEGIYGASSMGALRAADLAEYGMIGCGKIFQWYHEGVISDESEVACVYGGPGGIESLTIPLVNIRGAILKALEMEIVDDFEAETAFRDSYFMHWTVRTLDTINHDWLKEILLTHDQKRIDALELLCTYQNLPKLESPPIIHSLGMLFSAQFERERSVTVGHTDIRLQDIESQLILHDPSYEQTTINADNRELALMLADIHLVNCTQEDLDKEWEHFKARLGIHSLEAHTEWLESNHLSMQEFKLLLSEEVRLRKLRRALMVVSGHRRRTARLLNHLRANGGGEYRYWSHVAAIRQRNLDRAGGEEAMNLEDRNTAQRLYQTAAERNQTISMPFEDYVTEFGWGTSRELLTELERDRLGSK